MLSLPITLQEPFRKSPQNSHGLLNEGEIFLWYPSSFPRRPYILHASRHLSPCPTMQGLNLLTSSFTLYRDASLSLTLLSPLPNSGDPDFSCWVQNPISLLTEGQFNYISPCQMVAGSITQLHELSGAKVALRTFIHR